LSQSSALSKSSNLQKRPAYDRETTGAVEPAESGLAWKQEVNDRLAAHRNRRSGAPEDAVSQAVESPRAANARAAEAVARVAARYAKAPSYSQLLAGEARAVVRAAGAAAEAARSAQAAAEAVLAGLEAGLPSGPVSGDRWDRGTPLRGASTTVPAQTPLPPAVAAAPVAQPRWQDEPPAMAATAAAQVSQESPWAGAQPRWEEALPPAPSAAGSDLWSEMRLQPAPPQPYRQDSGSYAERTQGRERDEDLLFSDAGFDARHGGHDPWASATVEPVQHLPANLIEFPRELVAARKARPRLAEGPLYDPAPEHAQLSIFEVDPQLLAPPISMTNATQEGIAPPEWASIELDHPEDIAEAPYLGAPPAGGSPAVYADEAYASEVSASCAAPGFPLSALPGSAVEDSPVEEPRIRETPAHAWISDTVAASAPPMELLVARVSDRLLAAVVDGALVTLAVVAAAVVVIAATAHPPTGRIALIASGLGLLLFGMLYQFLFLSYAEEGTPGMRYARIALCTFEDDNPTVAQMRLRIPAMLLSALPAGLGLIWVAFDRDRLSWHDRLTRTYQRKY